MSALRISICRLVLGVTVAVAGPMMLATAPALALLSHESLFQFNEIPAGAGVALPGEIYTPEMTVDAGHLWATEFSSNHRVDEFDAATGTFVAQPVHNTTSAEYLNIAAHREAGATESQLYVTEYTKGVPSVGVYSEAGTELASWTGAGTPSKFKTFALFGVAADNSMSPGDWAAGDVYVPVDEEKVVDVFKPEAGSGYAEHYVTHLTGTCATPTACTTERFTEPRAVAVNSVNGDVYVTDHETAVDVFEPTALGEYAFVRKITGTPRGGFQDVYHIAVDGSGNLYVVDTLKGTKNGASPVVDQFDPTGFYVGAITGTSSGRFPSEGFIGSVAADPVSGDIYVYDYPGSISSSYVYAFGPSVVLPDVTTEPASKVAPESVLLTGTVNPDKAGPATCWFEYGTTTSFGQRVPCTEEVKEGESTKPVEARIEGLQPDTTYHFRLEAGNANGTNAGEPAQDQEFHTPGPGIQGAYVTDVSATAATFGASIDPNGAPTSYYFQYSASNTMGCGVSGCVTLPAAPGKSIGAGHGDVSVAPEYLEGLLADTTYHYRVVVLSELEGKRVPFFGSDQTFTTQVVPVGSLLPDGRSWELVSPAVKRGALICPLGCEGATKSALSGAAFTYLVTSPPDAEPEGYTALLNTQMFATRGPSGWVSRDISLPHAAPTGESVGEGAEYRVFNEDLSLAVVQPFGPFVSSMSVEASEQTPYLRTTFVHGNVNDPCTEGCFRPLVTGKPGYSNVAPGTRFGGGELGRSTESGCPPKLLYCGPEFIGASSDLKHVVVLSNVALTEGGGTGEYEWSEGRLTPGNNLASYESPAPTVGSWPYSADVEYAAQTSPNGRWVAFMSQRSLIGYDNRDAVSGDPDEEVYLYHAPEDPATESGELVCASCNPTGARPTGVPYKEGLAGVLSNFFSGGIRWLTGQGIAANITGEEHYKLCCSSGYQPRYLSDSGRLFFDSSDALVPQDVNGAEDVYEYEPPGVGSCTSASVSFSKLSGGCIGLISSGGAVGESAFMDASETGSDVFFMTYGKLVAQDSDSALDVYDAHECSSISPCVAPAPASPPPCSTGDSCKPAPSPQPTIFGSPSSETFSGAGNVVPSVPAAVKAKAKPKRKVRSTVKCKKRGRKRGCAKAKRAKRSSRIARRNGGPR